LQAEGGNRRVPDHMRSVLQLLKFDLVLALSSAIF